MTPQEKAKELVGKIFHEQHIDESAKLIGISSKKIAIICVDEIQIYLNTKKDSHQDWKSWGYWNEVRQEIEKL